MLSLQLPPIPLRGSSLPARLHATVRATATTYCTWEQHSIPTTLCVKLQHSIHLFLHITSPQNHVESRRANPAAIPYMKTATIQLASNEVA